MTDSVAAPGPAEPAQFQETWVQSLSQVLGQISGSAVPCAALTEVGPEIAARVDTDLWLLGGLSGGLRGEMSLRLASGATIHFAQILMGEASTNAPPEMTAEHREAAVELMRQVAGLVSTSLTPRWGEVQLRLEAAEGVPTWAAASTVWLRAGDDPATAVLVELSLSAALVATLRAEPADEMKASANAISAPENSVNLGLLMDVELAVTLRFGSRRLLLREVLDLNPGAILELDRQVNEPVEMLLDGRLLARGEVVVMDGNYALRVTEIAPPQAL